MKVLCKTNCATANLILVAGEEYDLPADVVESLGSLVEPVTEDKPAPKKTTKKAAK